MMLPDVLLQALEVSSPARLLVLGDLILDQYTTGEAERISQEAPILVLQATDEQWRPGGAANVAAMCRALGADVLCAGIVGDDVAGKRLREQLAAQGIDTQSVLVDESRPTTVKERFVGLTDGRNAHQILRVDREVRTPLSELMERRLASDLEAVLPRCQGVLIPDYGKGVCTPRLLRRMIAAARRLGIPVLVDPLRGSDYERYRGATLIKPNRVETAVVTGTAVRSPPDALQAAEQLCSSLDIDLAIVTLDRDGMALFARGSGGQLFPTQARNVCDITGAGDSVLATLGVFLGEGRGVEAAIHLANMAAGLEVEQVGVVAITREQLRQQVWRTSGSSPKIVDRVTAGQLAELYRRAGKRIAFTNGCYDLLHAGHVLSLSAAAAEGEVLFVGVNSDQTIRRLKGAHRPIVGERDRMAVLAALACVDHVVLFEEETPHALLETIRPDVLVKGGTYSVEQVVGREVVEAYGGVIRVTPVVEGLSTTKIVETVLTKVPAPSVGA